MEIDCQYFEKSFEWLEWIFRNDDRCPLCLIPTGFHFNRDILKMASDLRNKRLEELCLENMNLENKSELFCNHKREEVKGAIP